MKHPSVTSPKQEEDVASDIFLTFADDDISCHDATKLQQELMFWKGAMKAREDEMSRLREEKNEAIDSKFRFMAEMGGLKKEVEMQAKQIKELTEENWKLKAKMLVQAQKEKEEAQKECAKEIKEGEEKCAAENEMFREQQIVNVELDAKVKDVIEKAEMAKEESEKGTRERKMKKTSKVELTDLSLKEALSKIWKNSRTKFVCYGGGSVLYDVLNCAPLKSGTFEWKIQVHSADTILLGVIGSSRKLPLDNWIGNTKKTWGYRSHNGYAWYWNDGKKYIKDLPKYTAGSVVHFVLNLTNEGTLCVSVDGSPLVQAFSNMKSLIDKDEGFLPATSMWSTNKIELLEFKCR